MPTDRDYLIATVMGENNRGTVQSQQGVLDTILNRQLDPTQYGARRGASIQDIVTARTGSGYQYDAWRPELNGRPNGQFALSNASLAGGQGLSGQARQQYEQAAGVVDRFLQFGEGRGIAQGATFYQTPTAPNPWQQRALWGPYGNITVGDHIYSGPGLIKDAAEYRAKFPGLTTAEQAPAPGTDGFGTIIDYSGFDTPSGAGATTGTIGSPNFGGGITPEAPPGPAPGPYDFANGGAPGGVGDANFGAGITPAGPSGPAPGPYDFANGSTAGGAENGSFGFGITPNGGLPSTPAPTLAPPPGTSTINSMYEAILRRPGDAAGLQAFDAQLDSGKMDLNQIQAMLRGSEEAKTLGPLGEARTYSPLETVFARQLDRAPDAQAIQNWGTAQNIDPVEAFVYGSPEAQTYRAGLGDTASLIRNPSTAPTIGPGGTAGTVGPGATTNPIGPFGFTGTFKPTEYLQANSDVAAANIDPLTHYLTYGYNEGRNLDTAGHRVNQGFDAKAYLAGNQDVAKAGLDPLEHYVQYGAAEGRSLPTGSTAPYQFSGANVSQGAGNGSFSGTFDGAAYLKQNGDVAAAGMNPLDHYLRYGFAEGRAIDPQGHSVAKNFDPNAYLAQNRDVADAKLDPLAHYLLNGASEGRAAPTGSNPYSFSNFNVAQGAGPVGNGSFGLGGITGGQSGSLPQFGSGFNVSQNVPNGSFGTGITQDTTISPFGFTGTNPSGALGATPQNFGGAFGLGGPAPGGGGGGESKDNIIDPYGFGGDVAGYDVNGPGGAPDGVAGERQAYWDGAAIQGRNSQASQNAFIAGELKKAADNTASGLLAGQQITNVAPGNQTNYALGAINPTPTPQIQHTQFTPVNMSGVFAPPPTIAFMPRFTG